MTATGTAMVRAQVRDRRPRAPRVALTALGCKVNYAEMAELAGALAAAGCEVVGEAEQAEVRVLNSCTVTLEADATTRQRLRRLRRLDPAAHIVLTGCSVDGNPDVYLRRDGAGAVVLPPGVDAVFANACKPDIAAHVLRVAGGDAAHAAPPRAPRLRARAFLKVQDGCDHRCTYCAVWRARGPSRSLPPEAAVARARAAADAGHGEIVLTGVDLGSYGRDLGIRLHTLVARILDEIGDGARLRLSSINSNDVSAELIALNAHPRLCSHWHMPLQSGSDAVLRAMHRGYRRRQFLGVCERLRAVDPDTELTSDIMVGFPGETEEDHAATLSLIDEAAFLDVHVFRHSPRPGTPAALLAGAAAVATARRRSAEAVRAAVRTGRQRRCRAIGRIHQVVWDGVSEGRGHGLTAGYHEVVAALPPQAAAGSLDRVLVTAVDDRTLHGTVVPDPPPAARR